LIATTIDEEMGMRILIDARRAAIDLATKNAVGAEVGVHLGEFSSVILSITRPKKLYLIDAWKYFSDPVYIESMYGGERDIQSVMDGRYETVLRKFNREITSGVVSVHREMSVDAARRIADAELDFLYIDGDHSYEGVSRDLKAFFP
jgi:hypothetical protein